MEKKDVMTLGEFLEVVAQAYHSHLHKQPLWNAMDHPARSFYVKKVADFGSWLDPIVENNALGEYFSMIALFFLFLCSLRFFHSIKTVVGLVTFFFSSVLCLELTVHH